MVVIQLVRARILIEHIVDIAPMEAVTSMASFKLSVHLSSV